MIGYVGFAGPVGWGIYGTPMGWGNNMAKGQPGNVRWFTQRWKRSIRRIRNSQ